jgi:hypothetical protein
MSWAENLNIGDAADWSLPTAFNQDGSGPLYEYNVIGSELGHLYYADLGSFAGGPLMDTEPFANLQPFNYWSSTTVAQFAGNAFAFSFNNGRQAQANKALLTGFSAIAVHSGNVCTPVSIDIRPWNKRNPINYIQGHGIVPVTIHSTKYFDAPREIDQDSLTFGTTGNEQSFAFCEPKPEDGKRHGLRNDLVCYCYIEVAGFGCGDTEGILKSTTLSGIVIEGKDLVKIISCN